MSIRFKFWSAGNFESMEVGDRASISVGELRAKILRGHVSRPQQQGFDLVFSDAVSGLEYKGDDFQIPRGSTVIVRRLPCGAVPAPLSLVEAVNNVEMKGSYTLNPAKEASDDFADFGPDLFSSINATSPPSIQEVSKKNLLRKGMEDFTALRLDHQNLVTNNFNETTLRGIYSMELKCPLCKYYLKEAVMIPCCQHSFCENCIRQVLTETGRCPKCFSSQCSVENLLPNLSLRDAIRCFLECQVLHTSSENHDLNKYAPDRGSGIGAEGISYTLTVVQREPEVPQTSCATGKGSNQVVEPCDVQQPQRNVPFAHSGNHNNLCASKDNEIEIHKSPSHSLRWGKLCTVFSEMSVLLIENVGIQGIRRTCFTCGSPYHLRRDCPANVTSMFQPGVQTYGPSYGVAFPPCGSYENMCSNLGLMPFNASMAIVAPYAMPPYNSSLCGGSFVPRGRFSCDKDGGPHTSSEREHDGLSRESVAPIQGREVIAMLVINIRRDNSSYGGTERRKYCSRRQFSGDKDFGNSCKSPERAQYCLLQREVDITNDSGDDCHADDEHKKKSNSSYGGRQDIQPEKRDVGHDSRNSTQFEA
ncbi:hypothetical protein F511_04642 [Dorcoceras hygrometricum]|uniref:Uncharacterized protein n=1 Tax=Dorcoceras hygrometricum TaxID=472368 RepID=A0A2Z7BRI8_9LAMI|nr:hypothetical protein F511_04642 [Dorcoceras hygrometricum]